VVHRPVLSRIITEIREFLTAVEGQAPKMGRKKAA